MTDPRIERMIEETRQQASLSHSAVRDLREAIESSPYLSDVMVKAIDAGHLRRIAFDPPSNEGGHYDAESRTISINASILDRPNQVERVDQLTAILGHETGHALMARSTYLSANRLSYELEHSIKQAAQYGEQTADATGPAAIFVAASRRNEGFAELVGMNAVASRVTATHPGVGLAKVLQRLDPTTQCVANGELAAGIQLGHDFMQRTGGTTLSPAVEAVSVCQFDRSAGSLGELGASNYNAYYLSYVVSTGAGMLRERSQPSSGTLPYLGLNFDSLGSSAAEIERVGVPLGGQGKIFNLMDTSSGSNLPVEIRQIGERGQHVPALPLEISPTQRVLVDDAAHPDHHNYRQIHDWVKATGNWNDVECQNVAAALYKAQLENPTIREVHQVTGAMGKQGEHNVFAVYAPFGESGPFFHSHVDGRYASQQPAEQNLQQAEDIRQSHERQLTQDRVQQHEQAQPAARQIN